MLKKFQIFFVKLFLFKILFFLFRFKTQTFGSNTVSKDLTRNFKPITNRKIKALINR
jgi:hypothetical protein